MRCFKHYLMLLSTLLLLVFACRKTDDFTTSGGDKLSFSSDTLRFDTAFTTVGSATRYIKVFNRNDKPIRISKISLGNKANAVYNLNIDGIPGRSFENVEIGANDSIYVFAEVNINPNAPLSISPFVISEDIVFETNGNTQKVVMEAWGQNANYITLNRPTKKNALHPVMVQELAYALCYAHYERSVWAVVVRANGDVFCAGADLKAFMGSDEIINSTVPEALGEILIGNLFNGLHKPAIAEVSAPVLAGGFLLICGCQYVVAKSTATFSLPETKRGLFPMQVLASLLDIMPARRALDLCMRGVTLGGEEALQLGLVTHLCTADDVSGTVDGILRELFAHSPTAIRLGLQAYERLREGKADHAYLKEQLFACLQSDDAQEGIAAFREKRTPLWTGN